MVSNSNPNELPDLTLPKRSIRSECNPPLSEQFQVHRQDIESIQAEPHVRMSLPSIASSQGNGFRWFFVLGAFCLPYTVMGLFIIATREWIIVDTLWDYFGGGLAVAAGLICVWQLPITCLLRALISIIYIPIIGFSLMLFSLVFVMERYGGFL
jgi:hypothetical protein